MYDILITMIILLSFILLFLVQPPIQVFGVEGRYATALYSAASKQKSLDVVEKDLLKFQVYIGNIRLALPLDLAMDFSKCNFPEVSVILSHVTSKSQIFFFNYIKGESTNHPQKGLHLIEQDETIDMIKIMGSNPCTQPSWCDIIYVKLISVKMHFRQKVTRLQHSMYMNIRHYSYSCEVSLNLT